MIVNFHINNTVKKANIAGILPMMMIGSNVLGLPPGYCLYFLFSLERQAYFQVCAIRADCIQQFRFFFEGTFAETPSRELNEYMLDGLRPLTLQYPENSLYIGTTLGSPELIIDMSDHKFLGLVSQRVYQLGAVFHSIE